MRTQPLVSMQGKRDGVYYRLPSGVVIDDRVAWDRLALERIADDLSARVRTTIVPDLEHVQIVRWEHVREELADVVRDRIRSRHGVLALSQEDLGFRYGGFSPVAPGQWVILITGSILTGRTATTLLRALRRMEAEPLAVATVIDGRIDHGVQLSTFAGPVPVISCLQRTLVVDDATAASGHIVDVDSAGREARDPSRAAPEIPGPRFLSWLQRHHDSGVYIGHIERRRAGSGAYYRRARHFSTYLDMGRLIAQDKEPIEAVATNIRDHLGDDRLRERAVRVIYPATEGHTARDLASAAAARLSTDLGIDVSLVGAKRGAGGEWRLDDGPWGDCTAVIVDWGAVTTATIRALMALSLRNGAARIHAAVLTSQMSAHAERDLTGMASMRGDRVVRAAAQGAHGCTEPEQLETVEIPVSASFLASVPMGIATISDCHLCHLAHEFRRQAVRAPTRLLREHATRKVELYRPRSRDEVTARPATDVAGTRLGSAEAAKIWECHGLLEQIDGSRAARARVREAILALGGAERDRVSLEAWIRLLTVDSHWLNRAPLSASDMRSAIARACIGVLSSEGDRHAPGVRWQAAIVLRVASKHAFVANFAHILVSSREDANVAAELCQGMLTLLEKPYNHRKSILKAALEALHDAREQLVMRAKTQQLSDEIRTTLNTIHRRATELRKRVGVGSMDALASWHALQRSYAEPIRTHDGVVTSMLVVVNALSGPGAQKKAARTTGDDEQRPGAYWKNVGEAWSHCWDFLAQSVFPHLPALRDQLERVNLGGDTMLLELDNERAARLTDELARLERHPRWFSPGVRVELETEAFQWFDAFLRAPETRRTEPRDSSFAGALLLRVLTETPCNPASAWEVAVSRGRDAGLRLAHVSGGLPPQLRVFCPRSLLIDVFGQVLQNAARTHASRRCPERGVDIDVSMSQSGDTVAISVKNNWSQASTSHDGGLARFREELAMFGAGLAHADLAAGASRQPGDWTYDVTMQLGRWQELK